MVRLIIFGALGTLVDCLDLQRQALNAAFAAHAMPLALDPETYRPLHRPLGERSVVENALAAMDTEAADIDALVATFRQRLEVRLTGPLPLRPGLAGTFRWAGRHGVGLALLSSSAPGIVRRVLASTAEARSGVVFDAITVAADGVAMRPEPEGYQEILAQTGTPPAAAIAVEDLPEGIVAAQAASVPVLAFPHPRLTDLDFGRRVPRTDAVTPEALVRASGRAATAAAE